MFINAHHWNTLPLFSSFLSTCSDASFLFLLSSPHFLSLQPELSFIWGGGWELLREHCLIKHPEWEKNYLSSLKVYCLERELASVEHNSIWSESKPCYCSIWKASARLRQNLRDILCEYLPLCAFTWLSRCARVFLQEIAVGEVIQEASAPSLLSLARVLVDMLFERLDLH